MKLLKVAYWNGVHNDETQKIKKDRLQTKIKVAPVKEMPLGYQKKI